MRGNERLTNLQELIKAMEPKDWLRLTVSTATLLAVIAALFTANPEKITQLLEAEIDE